MVQLRLGGWYPMSCAPEDCTWVLVLLPDESTRVAHWASDLSGEEQPCFQGWFVARQGRRGFFQIPDPIGWMPI